MADEIRKGGLVPQDLDMTFRDMLDGTFAPVIAADVIVNAPPVDPPDVSTVTAVNDSATSATLVAANANRKAFVIFNASKKQMYFRFGAAAASPTDFTWTLESFRGVTFPSYTYTGAITAIWDADTATGKALVTEIT